MNDPVKQVWNQGQQAAAAAYKARRVTIDPVTRLEGHGKIDIHLNENGDVQRAYFQVPELRGFEVFSIGRPARNSGALDCIRHLFIQRNRVINPHK